MDNIYGIPVKSAYDGVAVVSVCDLLDGLYGSAWTMDYTTSYEERQATIMAWCLVHGAHYYARGREEFDELEGIDEARVAGRQVVVMEDLS
jgi:hypothetical protein